LAWVGHYLANFFARHQEGFRTNSECHAHPISAVDGSSTAGNDSTLAFKLAQ
jgi:hypothetical protein